ncbi:hypothetical protein D3C76_1333290 [compost metagenome]
MRLPLQTDVGQVPDKRPDGDIPHTKRAAREPRLIRQGVIQQRKHFLAGLFPGVDGGVIALGFRGSDQSHQDWAVCHRKRLVRPVHPFFPFGTTGRIIHPQAVLPVLRRQITHDGVGFPQG